VHTEHFHPLPACTTSVISSKMALVSELDERMSAMGWYGVLHEPCEEPCVQDQDPDADFEELLAAALNEERGMVGSDKAVAGAGVHGIARVRCFREEQPRCLGEVEAHLRQREPALLYQPATERVEGRGGSSSSWIAHHDLVRCLADADRDAQLLPPEMLRWASETLHRSGVVCIENVIPPGVVDQALAELQASWVKLGRCIQQYEERYNENISAQGRTFREGDWRGPGRYDVSYGSDTGTFATPHFDGNPILLSLVRGVLGRCDMFQCGSVISLPGSATQTVHFDSPHLVDPACKCAGGKPFGTLPPYLLTAFLNLVDLDGSTGCTAFAPGSHRSKFGGWGGCASPPKKGRPEDGGEFVYIQPPKGSLVIFDARVYHYGTANTGTAMRPLFYNLFSQPFSQDPGVTFGSRSLVEECEAGQHAGPIGGDPYHQKLAFQFMQGFGAYG